MKTLLKITELPVGDGRGVLTSVACLKYFHKASHLPTTCSYMLNQKSARTVMQEITRIFNLVPTILRNGTERLFRKIPIPQNDQLRC